MQVLRLARRVLIEELVVAIAVRVALWVLLVIAPGGVFLLPLLLGDAMARRRRVPQDSVPDGSPLAPAVDTVPASVSGP